ncbi:hypothetical protein [Pseudacidovorax intermedius]|uniref:DUF3024 domain-containing protein n=1 Tax=Pseudacidovorax intermedius TaxID=433924 RepID=UPI0026ED5CB4|nr:hypothetical protein [Pseudacidovorax intermedius]
MSAHMARRLSMADTSAPSGGGVADFLRHRIAHALRERARYRYVRPRVLGDGAGYRIESPCCSRNVDAEGGVIDIARLQPMTDAGGQPCLQGGQPLWQLQARDHAAGRWAEPGPAAPLQELLAQLCADTERVYWP